MNQEDVAPPEETTAAIEMPESAEPAAGEITVAELSAQLIEARRTADDNWEKFLRTQAEMENLKRRAEKDLQNAHKFALERFARELLTVADSLELGLQAAVGDSPEVLKLREGMELTLRQFLSVLEKFNVVPIDPEGEKFNPELHQAMAMQPSEDAAPNTVLKVFQKGYLLNERLLRPSMVVVAQGT